MSSSDLPSNHPRVLSHTQNHREFVSTIVVAPAGGMCQRVNRPTCSHQRCRITRDTQAVTFRNRAPPVDLDLQAWLRIAGFWFVQSV